MSSAEEDELPSQEEEEAEDSEGEEGEEGSGSGEEGSEDEDEDDEEEEGSEEEGSPRPAKRQRKSKPFVAPPPREMPVRTTRGARGGNLVATEGDDEFWAQEFFAEEEQDERYETESEPEDRFDRDFDEEEDVGDEDEEAEAAEADAVDREPRKKVLRPPGYKRPPEAVAGAPRPKPRPPSAEQKQKKKGKQQRGSSIGLEDFEARRAVRDSTRQKVDEAAEERKLMEKLKPKRVFHRKDYRPLTQAELLAEAAKTEIENTRSLQAMVAMEEELKRKANVQKKRYAGPMLRFSSRLVDGQEMTSVEVRNMQTPPELQPQVAPAPPPRAVCAVTGQPARYRDPASGLPYANLEAYKELQRRRQGPPAAPHAPLAAQLPYQPHYQLHYQQQQQQQQPGLVAPAGDYWAPPGVNSVAAMGATQLWQQQQQQQQGR